MTISQQDKVEIAELNIAFAGLLDEQRFPEVAALFSPDGILNRVNGTTVVGRAEIQSVQEKQHQKVQTVHHVATPMIEPMGDGEARGRASFVAVSVNRDDGSTQGWVTGFFDDRYRRCPEGWQIAERTINLVHRNRLHGDLS